MTKLIYKTLSLVLACLIISRPALSAEETCELVSNEYVNLIASVKALENDIKGIPRECAGQGETSSLASASELKVSTAKLQGYWNNQSTAAQDSEQFGNTLTAALASVNNISSNIKNSALNPACEKFQKQDGFVKLTTKLADVFSAIAPIAMMASVFVPALAVVNKGTLLAGMMGLTAVSSILSTANELIKGEVLDMENDQHRKMILKGICEYKKIKQNVDFINYMNSGRSRLEREQKALNDQIAELERLVRIKNAKLGDKIVIFRQTNQNIENEEKKINQVRLAMDKIEISLASMPDKHAQCGIVNEIAKGNYFLKNLTIKFPQEAFNINNINVANINGRHLEAAILENQRKIIYYFGVLEKDPGKVKECAEEVEKWRKNLPLLLVQLSQMNRKSIDFLLAEAKKDPTFLEWFNDNYKNEKERQLLERIQGYMSFAQGAGSIIAEADLNLQVASLQKQLIGNEKKSLAGLWVNFMLKKYNDGVDKFKDGFYALNQDANMKMVDAVKWDRKDTGGYTYRMKTDELRRKTDLEIISSKNIDRSTDLAGWQKTCRQLSDLDALAGEAESYFGNVTYLCNFLEKNDLNRSFVDESIVRICWGSLSIRDSNTKSTIARTIENMAKPRSLRKQSSMVKSKIMELQCPTPKKPKA